LQEVGDWGKGGGEKNTTLPRTPSCVIRWKRRRKRALFVGEEAGDLARASAILSTRFASWQRSVKLPVFL
jgi:hypothetical protein